MALSAARAGRETAAMSVIKLDSLPLSTIARELEGHLHGAGVCLIFVDAPPGGGPGLHTHPYEEVFIVQEGTCTFTVGDEAIPAGPGDILVVPAEVPHAFVNDGDGPLKQIDIHVSPRFDTTWL